MTKTTGTAPSYFTLPCDHVVLIAYRDPLDKGVLHAERLLNSDGLYGVVTVHGQIYKRTPEELVAHLRFIFDVREVRFTRTTLVY